MKPRTPFWKQSRQQAIASTAQAQEILLEDFVPVFKPDMSPEDRQQEINRIRKLSWTLNRALQLANSAAVAIERHVRELR